MGTQDINRLKSLLDRAKAAGVTMKVIAEKLEVSEATVYARLKGTGDLTPDQWSLLESLADGIPQEPVKVNGDHSVKPAVPRPGRFSVHWIRGFVTEVSSPLVAAAYEGKIGKPGSQIERVERV